MKMQYKRIVGTLLVLMLVNVFIPVKGQTVKGWVLDMVTGSPLVGATVIINETDPVIGATTNADGEFELKNIETGRWTFTASLLGYKPQTVSSVMVLSGKQTQLTFKLDEKVTNLNDVVIKANSNKNKPLNELALISTRAFSVEQTERFAGSLGDPARMVSNFAGVVVGNDSRNDIVIRGNSPSGLLWRIEGVDVPNPNHFGAQGATGGPVSMLNNNLLANSDFMTGAFAPEYGNALSGVFDLNLRSGNKDKYEFTGQIGFNGFELAAEGPIKLGGFVKNGSFIVDYRYSTMQLMSKLGLDMGTGTAIPEYNDLSVIVDLPTAKSGRFKFIGLYGGSFISMGRSFEKDELITHNQSGYATDFGANLNVSMLTHTLMFNDKARLKTSLSYQESGSTTLNDSIDYTNKSYFNHYAGRLSEQKLTASTQFKYKLDAENNFNIGFSANGFITTFNDSILSRKYNKRIILSDIDNKNSVLYKAFFNWQHKFTDQLTLNSGLHYQLYDLNNESSLEPRVGLKWQAAANDQFTFGYGLHSQIQSRTIYFAKEYDNLSNSYAENNRNLGFTRAQHMVLGYEKQLAKDFRLKTEAYFQEMYHVPVSKKSQEFSLLNAGSGYFIPRMDSLQNTGSGYNYGLELTLEKTLSNGYYALMTVSLYDSKYKAYDDVWRNTAFNSNFALNFLAGYELKVSKRNYLTFDVRTVWAGGMRYIPIDLEASIATGEETYDMQHAYENRYNDYFRTDFRIGFKMNSKKVSQEWAIDLQNLTNHKNVFSQQYNVSAQEVKTVYQQSFLPMMLYRINF